MKNFILFFLFAILPVSAFSQKVTVKVIKEERPAVSDWQILDEAYRVVFSGNEYYRSDSVIFSLEANKRYIFQVSVLSISESDTGLYTLILNDEPLMFLKTDIGTGDHFFPFFTGVRNQNVKITGGTTAFITDFPYQVYYVSGDYRCGGSIIGNKWILTAAHCTEDDYGNSIPAAAMRIRVGLNNPANPADGQTYYVRNVIVHENFDNQTLKNDIAILELQDTINNPIAKRIKLVTSEDVANGATDPGVMSWVTGWGLISVNPDELPTSLQKVQLPIVTIGQAAIVWGNSIPSTDLMAGYLNGNKDACNGDSGGPLVVPVFGEYKLAGIVSWGSASCDTYGAYTRVSLFEDWIRSKTGIKKEYWPPVPEGDTVVCQGTVSSDYTIGTLAGATAYEWNLLPVTAGAVSGTTGNATVTWNNEYSGSASLLVRVTINDTVSEWSQLEIKLTQNTLLQSQSADTVICAEQPVILKVQADGYNLNYNWYKNDQLIQSGPSSQLGFSSALEGNSGNYLCQISGYCGNAVSDTINMTVYPLTNIKTISPDVSVLFGDDATLEVDAEGHDLIYQWQKDGTLIENSDSSRLLLKNVNAVNIGLYRVTVDGACGTKTSNKTYVYVKNAAGPAGPEVYLWPSVTAGDFHIALGNNDFYSVRIFDYTGRLFLERNNCQYETTFNVSTLPKGLCIVNVFNNKFRKSLKMIKE
jgi:secreted trypsin-like serine protease